MFEDYEEPAEREDHDRHADWDPAPAERSWYRSSETADRGYMVKRNGVTMIRLDRPNEEIIRSFQPDLWFPDFEKSPLNDGQRAQICHVADREVCRFTGKPRRAKKDWQELSETERRKLMKDGPGGTGVRQRVWEALQIALKPYVG